MTNLNTVGSCECTWKNCGHKGRTVPAADHGTVRVSPELCMACLFVCQGEIEDEEDNLPSEFADDQTGEQPPGMD